MLLTGPRSFDPAPFDDISFDLCARREHVVIMSADLSKYCQVVRVKNELPRRHLDVGMLEQNLLSIAAGVAKGGISLWPPALPATSGGGGPWHGARHSQCAGD